MPMPSRCKQEVVGWTARVGSLSQFFSTVGPRPFLFLALFTEAPRR